MKDWSAQEKRASEALARATRERENPKVSLPGWTPPGAPRKPRKKQIKSYRSYR